MLAKKWYMEYLQYQLHVLTNKTKYRKLLYTHSGDESIKNYMF